VSAFGFKTSKPSDLTPFAQRVFDTLAKYTAFPWPIMLAQCRRADVEPATLQARDLHKVIDFMSEGVARFTSPEKGEALRAELRALV